MLNFLPGPLLGLIALLLLVLNTLFWVPLLLALALVKLILPFAAVRLAIDPVLVPSPTAWIACNSGWMRLTQRTEWDVEGVAGLDTAAGTWSTATTSPGWTSSCCSTCDQPAHPAAEVLPQAPADLGAGDRAWPGGRWISRSCAATRGRAAQEPRDAPAGPETTRKACAKFALVPTSVMNFPRARASPAPSTSPVLALPPPAQAQGRRAGAGAECHGRQFHSLIDVTIVYPDGVPTFWHFLCGRLRRVIVRVQILPVPAHLMKSDYANDAATREAFAVWVRQLWQDKDAQISVLLESTRR
jgi:hypothetical protein